MNTKLHSSPFCDILFDVSNLMVSQIWKSATDKMTFAQFKTEQLQLAEIIKEKKPQTIYVDAIKFGFIITPDQQQWNADNLLTHFPANGVEKCGILVPTDIYIQISIEQALEEADKLFETKYFDDQKAMMGWLK